MAKFVLADPTTFDAATLAGSNTVETLPLSNLQTDIPFDRARFTSTSPYVVADLGAAVDVNLVWLGYTNVTSAATWRIRAASTEAGLTSSPGYDSGAVTAWPSASINTRQYPRVHALAFYSTAKSFRWWRVDISDAGNPDGYIDVGRMIVDAAFVPEAGRQTGASIQYVDPSVVQRPAAGGAIGRQIVGYREAAIPFNFRSRADTVGVLARLDRVRGRARPILYVDDPDDSTYLMDVTIYGGLESSPVADHFIDQYMKSFAISESEHP